LNSDQTLQRQQVSYEDDYDIITKFVFDPNLESQGLSKAKFGHINKNLTLTSLDKDGVARIIGLLDAVQILNRYNDEYFWDDKEGKRLDKEKAKKLYEKRKKQKQNGEIKNIAIRHVVDNKYEKTKDLFLSYIYSVTSTSAGKNANLLKEWKTNRSKQKQTLREETEPNWNISQLWSKRNTGRGDRR
jgi:hypothetical protein